MDDRRNLGGGRFVILRHEMLRAAARGSHWDFMLENKGILLTWELPQLPPCPPSVTSPRTFEELGIRRLPDHRIEYLEYEGPVSNDRGSVQRVDAGTYQLINDASEELVQVQATGRRFQIELRIPKAIFQQVDEHGSNHGSNAGELLQFLELS